MITLSVTSRETLGKSVKKLRQQGAVPAVIYGHGVKSIPATVERIAFDKVYKQVGESSLVDLVVDSGQPIKVLVQEVQFHPTTGAAQHVDFYQVRMDEKLEVDIPLKFVGEAPAVKELGGILIKAVAELKIECLPKDLVHEIEVDITSLAEFNQSLHVKDIKLPVGFKVLSPSHDEMVVTVAQPRSEAELAALKTEVKEDVSGVETVKPEKAKDEEVEEGAKGKAEPEKKDK
jgi:large subunit ribosomal protein L25